MRRALVACLFAGCGVALAAPASALEIVVLSAGAVEPGMRPVLAAFERSSGHTVRLSFAAAPELRTALRAASPAADVIVVPQPVLDELGSAGIGLVVPIGKVGIGVAVRPGAELPDIAGVDSLKRSLVNADSVVFNRASTGLYVEAMLQQLGIAEVVDAKATRYGDGASVMRHLLRGTSAHEIGFGAMTEIALFRDQGLRLVGPLPPALQHDTRYVALAWPSVQPTDRQRAEAIAALLRGLQSAEAQAAFAAAGIDVTP